MSITGCGNAHNHLSIAGSSFARDCARQHHRLREFMMDHPEVRAILGATD
jgi:hypothetical protein